MPQPGFLKEHSTLLSVIMHLVDWLAVLVSALLAHRYYLETWSLRTNYDQVIFIGLVLTAWLFAAFGLYRVWRGNPFLFEVRELFLAWSSVFISMALLATLTKTGAEYSRGWFLLWFALGLTLLLGFRGVLRFILRILRKRGYNLRQIVIIGTRDTVEQVISSLDKAPWAGLEVVGVFWDMEEDAVKQSARWLGSVGEVENYVSQHKLDQVWIALPLKMEDMVHDILHDLRHATVDIRYVPDLFSIRLINHSVSTIAGMSVIDMSASPMIGFSRIIKFLEDWILALLIVILASPLLMVIAVAVKLSSPGPILYRQERVGWNGKSFEMLKFRSMEVDNEKDGVSWGRAQDKQVTGVGSFLRRTSLDELPQFFNVLMGDMSIVGPRPERTMFVKQFKDEIPGYMKKHMVKAGITGWAQINGLRGDTDLHTRVEYDIYYIENWSIWFDLRIILMTVFKGFASSPNH